MRVTTTLIAALTLSGCASSWKAMEGTYRIPTSPPPSVLEAAIAAQVKAPFAPWQVQRIEKFQGRGSFGRTNEIRSEVTIRTEEGGRTQLLMRRTWGDEKSAQGQVIRELAMCGLQVLSGEATASVLSTTGGISVFVGGTTFTSGSGQVRLQPVERVVVDSLSKGAAAVCTPKPGAEYAYDISRRFQNQWSNTQNALMTLIGNVKCQAANAKIAASSVVPGLEGDALEMKCVATYKNEGAKPSRYAFFETLGAYLPLETDEPERGTTQYEYVKATRSVGG